ncbi:MAG: PQQ-binding-like beta-propeller repeat protein [Propionibacteriaceae bacterium]|jgi:outer membrane protein assembly factor BamB|nr:PQQ-binding-like beta-propeller repeat protein [Propionibacteriaceae bacterium]
MRKTLGLFAVMAVLAGCTAPDTVRDYDRPSSPSATESTPLASAAPYTAIALRDVPGYQPTLAGDGGWISGELVDGGGNYSWHTESATGEYQPAEFAEIVFQRASEYAQIPGVLTFRGNNYRNAPTYGTADIKEKKLEIVWTQEIGEVRGDGSYWPGAGWTGQPLLVNWPEATRRAMGFADEFANKDLVEVIYPVFEGKVYRLDLETGKQTKDPIDAGCGFKGTGSIDPRGYPLLYAGQGLNDMDDDETTDDCPFRYRIFDLIQNVEVSGWEGTDPAAPRTEPEGWGAFDSSALVNAAADTLIEPGENGLIYRVKLNSEFDGKRVSVNPELTRLEYRTPSSEEFGIESSAVAWKNLMWASDNDGNLLCWDAQTMTVLWVLDVGDDSDASIVLEDTPDGPMLYHGNTLDKRGKAETAPDGVPDLTTNLRKIDGLTGEIVWQYDVPTQADYPNNGGELATPLLGTGEISDLVIYNVSKTTSTREGDLIALDKETGKLVWRRHLGRYSWSSPVAITGDDGHQYGILCDSGGIMHLFDPNTGYDLDAISLGRNIEASPAVYQNMIVVASYAKQIFGIRVS